MKLKLFLTGVILTVVFVTSDFQLMAEDSSSVAPIKDSMTSYRSMAKEVLDTYNSGDMEKTKVKAKELEKAWDTKTKDLRKQSPKAWKAADSAMDDFIDPLLGEKPLDKAKVEPAYNEFLRQLDLAARVK